MHYNNELLTIDRQLIHSNVSLWYQALQTGIYHQYSLRKHKNIPLNYNNLLLKRFAHVL